MSTIHRNLKPGSSGGTDVRDLQAAVNRRLKARDEHAYVISVDGEYGPQTARSVSRAAYLLGLAGPRLKRTKLAHGGHADKRTQKVIRNPASRTKAQEQRADARLTAARKARSGQPLRERAYDVAAHEVGVMESGANNAGIPLGRYEKPNGAPGPEPWCGDFVAYCYRQAGSKAVTRSWASVYYLGRIVGVKAVSASEVKRGDIVRYAFSHTGLFVKWRPDRGPGYFETIEGNTGATGAVSDSSTGGDGVYRKVRHTSLVDDFRRVTR